MIRSDYLFDVDIDYDREKLLSVANRYLDSPSLWDYYTYKVTEKGNKNFVKCNYNEISNMAEIFFSRFFPSREKDEELCKVISQFEDIFHMTDKNYRIAFLKFHRTLDWVHRDINLSLCIPLSHNFESLRFYGEDEENDYFYKCALLNNSKKKHKGISVEPDRISLRLMIKSKTYEECKRIYFSS